MAEHLLLAWKDAMSFSGPLIMQSEVDVVAQEEWVCGSIFSRLELAAVCGAAAESCHANSLLTAVDATVPVPAVLSVLFFCLAKVYTTTRIYFLGQMPQAKV